jgi:hypothetical protein
VNFSVRVGSFNTVMLRGKIREHRLQAAAFHDHIVRAEDRPHCFTRPLHIGARRS